MNVPEGFPLSYFAQTEPVAQFFRILGEKKANPKVDLYGARNGFAAGLARADRLRTRQPVRERPADRNANAPPPIPGWAKHVRLITFRAKKLDGSADRRASGKNPARDRKTPPDIEYLIEFTTEREVKILLPQPQGVIAIFGRGEQGGSRPGDRIVRSYIADRMRKMSGSDQKKLAANLRMQLERMERIMPGMVDRAARKLGADIAPLLEFARIGAEDADKKLGGRGDNGPPGKDNGAEKSGGPPPAPTPPKLTLRIVRRGSDGLIRRVRVSGDLRFQLPHGLVVPIRQQGNHWVEKGGHVTVDLGAATLQFGRALRPSFSRPLKFEKDTFVRVSKSGFAARLGEAVLTGSSINPRLEFRDTQFIYPDPEDG